MLRETRKNKHLLEDRKRAVLVSNSCEPGKHRRKRLHGRPHENGFLPRSSGAPPLNATGVRPYLCRCCCCRAGAAAGLRRREERGVLEEVVRAVEISGPHADVHQGVRSHLDARHVWGGGGMRMCVHKTQSPCGLDALGLRRCCVRQRLVVAKTNVPLPSSPRKKQDAGKQKRRAQEVPQLQDPPARDDGVLRDNVRGCRGRRGTEQSTIAAGTNYKTTKCTRHGSEFVTHVELTQLFAFRLALDSSPHRASTPCPASPGRPRRPLRRATPSPAP